MCPVREDAPGKDRPQHGDQDHPHRPGLYPGPVPELHGALPPLPPHPKPDQDDQILRPAGDPGGRSDAPRLPHPGAGPHPSSGGGGHPRCAGGVIKENSGLDALNLCRTVIYDRFDGVEVTEEEMELFAKLSKLHVGLIIFNDGPVDLENDQYRIYNNLTVDEKLEVMDKASIAGPVAYIGDNSKDIALLQKAYVGISRGGIKDKKVIENSDIMLMNSDLNTVIETFMISKKQKYITIENIFVGLFINVILMILAVLFIIPWWLALVIYLIEVVVVLFNTHRIIDMK